MGIDGRQLAAADLDVDHIVPREQQGSDSSANLRATCRACNRHLANAAKEPTVREW